MATAKRLCPQNTFEQFALMVNDHEGSPDLARAFPAAREAVVREDTAQKNKEALPTFLPQNEVSKNTVHGYLIYRKYGLLTLGQFTKMFGKTPQQLGLNMVQLADGSKYFLISLDACSASPPRAGMFVSLFASPNIKPQEGLSEAARDGISKIKVYIESSLERRDVFLNGSTQLMPKQGNDVFAWVQDTFGDGMPKLTSLPKTAEQVGALAARLENELSAQIEEQLQDELAEEAELDPEAQARVLQNSSLLDAMQFHGERPSKKKRTAAATAAAAGKPTAAAAPPATIAAGLASGSCRPPSESPAILDTGSVTSAGSKKTKKLDSELSSLDEDMQKVAQFHIEHGSKSGSVKSLGNLRIENFMSPTQGHDGGHALPAERTCDLLNLWNLLNQWHWAKRIRDNMVKYAGDSQQYRLLCSRIRSCEVTQMLAVNSAQTLVEAEDADERMKLIEPLCPSLTWSLQAKLSLMHAIRIFAAFVSDIESTDGELSQQQRESNSQVIVDCVLPSLTKAPWQYDAPCLGCLLNECMQKLEHTTESIATGMEEEAKAQAAMDAVVNECQKMLQDAGTMLLEFMGCNYLFQVFKAILNYGPGLSVFIITMLHGLSAAKEAVQALKERDVEDMLSESWENLNSTLDRCEKMMRLVACVLALEVPESMKPITSSDFTWLIEKAPATFPEKTFRDVVDSEADWRAVCKDIVRTAASTTRLQPQLLRTMSSLEQLSSGQVPFTADRLTGLHDEIVELGQGLRQVHVQGLHRKARDVFCDQSQNVLGGSVSGVRSRDVEALLKCLSIFKDESSVPDIMKELQDWANDSAQSMALVDLKDLAAVSETNALADLAKVQAIMPRLRKLQSDEKTEDIYEALLSLVVCCFRTVLKEVKEEQGRLSQTTMIKRLGLIDALAGLVFDAQDMRAKAIKTHGTVLKSGAALARSIFDFEKTGKDVEMRFSRDKSNAALLGVLRTSCVFQQNVVQLRTAFEALAASIQKEMDTGAEPRASQQHEGSATEGLAATEEAESASEVDPRNALVAVETSVKDQDSAPKEPVRVQMLTLELLAVDSPGCFAGHLTSDVIVDGMLRVFSSLDESLKRRLKELDSVLSKVIGENDWKKSIDNHSSATAVLEIALQTIVALPQRGAALGKLLDSISQETKEG
ncbi:unnamed protein product [Symbiodinium microadriaticum]|nr:unnamed protein product [Symbiodinium microadriaticum]